MELGLDSFRKVAAKPATPDDVVRAALTEANHILSQLEAMELRLSERLPRASGLAAIHLQTAIGHARSAALVVRYGLGVSLECALRPSPECGHSACSQHYIETGEVGCVEGSTDAGTEEAHTHG